MKKHLRTSITICLAIFITVCFTGSVFAKNIGTIILKSGYEYENIKYEMFRKRKKVRFWIDSKKFSVKFKEILTILKQDGTEAYPQVFKDYQGTETRVRIFRNKIPFLIEKKKWKVAARVGVVYGSPSGSYYDGLSGGLGFGGSLKIASSNKHAFKLIYSSYQTDEVFVTTSSIAVNIKTYFVAVERFVYKNEDDSLSSLSYMNFGVGRAVLKESIGSPPFFDTRRIISDSRWAFTLGFGYINKMNKNLGIDFGGNLDILIAKRYIGGTTSKLSIIGNILNAKVGLIYFFGTD